MAGRFGDPSSSAGPPQAFTNHHHRKEPAMAAALTPSRIARFAAGKTWGNPVQSSRKLAPGIFLHDTPGHGGLVAVLDAATDLTPAGIAAARASGRIETVAVHTRAAGHRVKHALYGPSGQYAAGPSRARFEAFAAEHGMQLVEVWIGEEDSEYATILLASPAARAAVFARYAGTQPETDAGRCAELIGVCQRWQPDFLEHLNPDGMVAA
jgi:hypothetical protein